MFTYDDALDGHMGNITDRVDRPHQGVGMREAEATAALRQQALHWVRNTTVPANSDAPQSWQPRTAAPPICGLYATDVLDTHVVGQQIFAAAAGPGIVLFEPFGGMCAGLEACLRAGLHIQQYLYADTCPAAQRVARQRIMQLHAAYPTLLPAAAVEHALTALPQNVSAITPDHLRACGAGGNSQWLVVAGWPCQDLSKAGTQQGLQGARSGMFFDLANLVGWIHQLQPHCPPGYLFENAVCMADMPHDAAQLLRAAGPATTFDAAQFGARAHRVRSWWTNLCYPDELLAVLAGVQRPPNLTVAQVLDHPRVPRVAIASDAAHPAHPIYPINQAGQPLCALPTLVATRASYAFRDGAKGMIFDPDMRSAQDTRGSLQEPNPDERERAMGYSTGSTNAPGVTLHERHVLTGNAMDMQALQGLLSICWALRVSEQRTGGEELPVPGYASPFPLPRSNATQAAPAEPPAAESLSTADLADLACETAVLVEAAEAIDAPVSGRLDILTDDATLHYLQHGEHLAGVSAAEQRRVRKRSESYKWAQGQVWRIMPNGERRLVPPVGERRERMEQAHAQAGHLGAKRSLALLSLTLWWPGMFADVCAVVGSCEPCSRRGAVFNALPPQLNSLPIRGLFYRWSVDLAGPLPASTRGNTYIMLAIDHFSKHVVALPLADKNASTTAAAFRQHVLGVYGAPAEVLTDQGTEFRSEFHQLLTESFVDHRTTSAYHPQANGLAERAVQTIKRCVAKMAAKAPQTWDDCLPYAALGYNSSPQSSTGFAPYTLLHAVAPIVPPAIRPRFSAPIDLDDPVLAAQSVYERATALQGHMIMAAGNQLIAQHRDQLHYAKTRAGAYVDGAISMPVGSYVYVKQHSTSAAKGGKTFAPRTHQSVMRVVAHKDSGVMTLEGRCESKLDVNMAHCTPCHLDIIDHSTYPALARPAADLACEVCNLPTGEESMLMCDACGTGWHLACLNPPLEAVPAVDVWVCPECTLAGVDPATVVLAPEPEPEDEAPPALVRKAKGAHTKYDGIAVARLFESAESGEKEWYHAVAQYMGHAGREARFLVQYSDGDSEELPLKVIKVAAADAQSKGRKAA